eukprot:4886225-Pyramimonas_sp.AAC.2
MPHRGPDSGGVVGRGVAAGEGAVGGAGVGVFVDGVGAVVGVGVVIGVDVRVVGLASVVMPPIMVVTLTPISVA